MSNTKYFDEVIQRLNQIRKFNKQQFNHLIDEYLNKPFPNFLKGRKNTLASRGWTQGRWFINDVSLGWCMIDGSKKISFNQVFLNEKGVNYKFENVLKHEIAHALEMEKYKNTEDTNEDPKKRMLKTCEEVFDNANIGHYSVETDFSMLSKYMIIFEPIWHIDGYTTMFENIPDDYDTNNAYIQSTLINLVGLKKIKQKTTDNIVAFLKKLGSGDVHDGINKLERIRKKAMQSDFKYYSNVFEQLFYIQENFGKYLKSGMVGLGLLGSTFMLPNNLDAISYDKSTIKQNITDLKITKSDSSINIIAATIFDEAKGEKLIGRKAIASVINNRTKWKKYKNNPVLVCIAKFQFSGWNKGYINVDLKSKQHQQIWKECQELAKQIINGKFKSIIDSNHYYNPKLANPKWGNKMKNVKIIGNHKFGRLP